MNVNLACADVAFPFPRHARATDVTRDGDFHGLRVGQSQRRPRAWTARELVHRKEGARTPKHKLVARGLAATDVLLQVAQDHAPSSAVHPDAHCRQRASAWIRRTLDLRDSIGGSRVATPPRAFVARVRDNAKLERCMRMAFGLDEQGRKAVIAIGVKLHVGSAVIPLEETTHLVRWVPSLQFTHDCSHFNRVSIFARRVQPRGRRRSRFYIRGLYIGRLQCSF